MEASINSTESISRSTRPEALRAPAASVGGEGDADLRALELGTWLCALGSFFEARNHPFAEAEREEMLSRDFGGELRIAQTLLLRCSQLMLGLTQGERAAAQVEAGELDMLGAASFVEREETFRTEADVSSLTALKEASGDMWTVGQALLDEGKVGFSEWASMGKMLQRTLEGSKAAGELMRKSRQAGSLNLQPPLLALTEKLTPDALGTNILNIFSGLTLLLERLRFVEALLRRDQPLKQTLPLFTLVHEEARELLEMLEARALRMEGLEPATFEALDGTAYAVQMELRKTFEHELVDLSTSRHAPSLYAKVETAHGLLRDCFQQTLVALAQFFDSSIDAARLFSAFQTKLEQSLALRRDLWTLLELVRHAEQERERRPLAPLLERLHAFREGSMRHLMYKDWEAFERFIEELAAARGVVELGPVLHRFAAYLETLFGQVNMRAVLAEQPFDFPAVEG